MLIHRLKPALGTALSLRTLFAEHTLQGVDYPC
jgi:hypothetical protein